MYVVDLDRALQLFGPRLYQLHGQGESPMTITGLTERMRADEAHPRGRERLGSCRAPRTGVLVKIVDDCDRELPPGDVGEVVTRSDFVMGLLGSTQRMVHPVVHPVFQLLALVPVFHLSIISVLQRSKLWAKNRPDKSPRNGLVAAEWRTSHLRGILGANGGWRAARSL
jgi:hypothetical protein